MSLRPWQNKVIYFVLLDRFYNGDKTTDDFGKGEYDPDDDDCFQGGDLKGLTQKLPHIKALGFDAVWLTPPVHNQWINPYIKTRGFHGYWAYDFTKIDPHFGTLEDYQELVKAAHQLGLKVIQDIVVNHTGNYFTVDAKDYDPARPEKNWRSLDGSYPPDLPPKAPNDPLFRLNNPNIPEHKAAAVYNFTPNITDFNSREQTLTYAMGDLDDINLANPAVLKRFKEIYRYWIETAGVDGFRVDTVYYTPEDFYERFLHDEEGADPGIKPFAQSLGKDDFFVFGEVWSYDYKAINRYIKDGAAQRLDSAIDLPLNEALTQVFFRKLPTARLGRALRARRHNRRLWINFLDNHDVERICSRGSAAAVQQSLLALFTLPGIPCLTYGTEAGFTLSRQKMFDDKHFDRSAPPAAFLSKLIELRKQDPVFAHGDCAVERTSEGCGLFAYSMTYRDETCLAVFNTAPDAMFYELPAHFAASEVLLSSEGRTTAPKSLAMAPESYLLIKGRRTETAGAPAAAGLELRDCPAGAVKGTLSLALEVEKPEEVAELCLLADDNYGRRIKLDNLSGAFALDTAALGNGPHTMALLAATKAGGHILSPAVPLKVRNPYQLLARAKVPGDQKGGLSRKVHAPADPSYGGQLSLESVAAYTSGRDLQLRLRMAQVTNDWNPPHGYDHVYFNVLFDFPGQPGRKFFPKLGHSRNDFEFNAGFLLYGWGIRSFGAEDSTPGSYGAPLLGDVTDQADLKRRRITFTFSNRFFDSLQTFSGVKVFVSTWDGYLGEPRAIGDKKEDWSFFALDGQPGADLPKIFDHVLFEL
ncbi:MAG: alpha-amylase family glycosyl hydrolase [Elusimicrobia bacterium]|nr:alpha-amylase family glycosyl hydrolase [Elusimicrobiota bacterium]